MAADPEVWLRRRKGLGSLAVGAACGCDVSRLGVEVCDYVNHRVSAEREPWLCFGSEDIRRLAGDAFWRGMIFAAAPEAEAGVCCDGEKVARGIATLGGAVLSGQTCFDATRGMEGVFRVVVGRRGCPCGNDPALRFDPRRCDGAGLVQAIGDRFLEWSRERTKWPAGEKGRGDAGRIRVSQAVSG